MTADGGTAVAPTPAAPTARRSSPVRGGNALAGTGVLLRFALRRDRVRLPVWLAALLLSTMASAASFTETYATPEQRAQIAETMDSPAALAMTGPARYLDDYNFGSMLAHQTISLAAVMVGLMSVLMVVRHTRTEEETARAELLRSTVVGRHAHLTAALLLAVIANVGLGALLAVGLGSAGYESVDWGGSLLYGATHTALGLLFAGVAAVTAQFTANSRGALGMGFTVIGASYALRAVGDVGSPAFSWISPIGWAQRTYVYVDDDWWPLLLALVVTLVATSVAYLLSTRRDVGSGLRPARLGRRTASAGLSRPLGFALRLHRGLLISFGVGVFLLGSMYGSLLGDVEEMLEDIDVIQDALDRIGDVAVIDAFASMVIVVPAIVVSIQAVMSTLRARSEETSGRAEPLLATGLSRTRWLAGHLVMALAGGTVLLVVSGLGFGVAGAASAHDAGLLLDLTLATLVYAPAVWVSAGVAVALFGWLPRASALAWTVPVYGFVVGYLGEVLQFPRWLTNVSPFGHIPNLPAADLNGTPLLVLTALAAVLVALGLVGFSRRDLETK